MDGTAWVESADVVHATPMHTPDPRRVTRCLLHLFAAFRHLIPSSGRTSGWVRRAHGRMADRSLP
jgi:hypothetical protein